MKSIPPPLSKPDPRAPLVHARHPLPRCDAVEPESGERCEGKQNHQGSHACRVLVEWEASR